MQILSGPRQVGETALARAAAANISGQNHHASADSPGSTDANWIVQQWNIARRLQQNTPVLLVLDEIHKSPRWSEAVKML